MILLDKDTFGDEVLQAEGYVLVDFFGDGSTFFSSPSNCPAAF